MRTKSSWVVLGVVLLAVLAVGVVSGAAYQPTRVVGGVGEAGRFQVITDRNVSPAFLVDTASGQVWTRTGEAGAQVTWKELLAAPATR
jgi:hypothetical protein